MRTCDGPVWMIGDQEVGASVASGRYAVVLTEGGSTSWSAMVCDGGAAIVTAGRASVGGEAE